MEINTVEVSKSKLESLEKDHEFLKQIKELSEAVEAAKSEYTYQKDKALEKKKAYDTLTAELHDLIQEGPPKPDPQGKLPFAADEVEEQDDHEGEVIDAEWTESDDEPVAAEASDADEDEVSPEPATEAKAVPAPEIPAEIDALDITAKQKKALAATGAKTLADLVDIANGNWEDYPKGFASVTGLGPASIAKIAAQLPSTAVAKEQDPSRLPAETKRIKVMSFGSGGTGIEPGDEYDATITDDGVAEVVLPGQEPVTFQNYEYEIVESAHA